MVLLNTIFIFLMQDRVISDILEHTDADHRFWHQKSENAGFFPSKPATPTASINSNIVRKLQ